LAVDHAGGATSISMVRSSVSESSPPLVPRSTLLGGGVMLDEVRGDTKLQRKKQTATKTARGRRMQATASP
jgi:hypothetical protein